MMLFLILYIYLVISILSYGNIVSVLSIILVDTISCYFWWHLLRYVRGIVTSTVIIRITSSATNEVFSILYDFDVTIYVVHSDNTTSSHSKISYEDSIRRFLSTQVHLFWWYFALIGKWTAIASIVTFSNPSDSSPTIFYHRYNIFDPFDIDIHTDDGDDAAVMLLMMMMILLLILPISFPKW